MGTGWPFDVLFIAGVVVMLWLAFHRDGSQT